MYLAKITENVPVNICHLKVTMHAQHKQKWLPSDYEGHIPCHGGGKLEWEVWQYEAVQPVGEPCPLMCCQSLRNGQSHLALVLLEWTGLPGELEMQCYMYMRKIKTEQSSGEFTTLYLHLGFLCGQCLFLFLPQHKQLVQGGSMEQPIASH